jgi:hypothetical protein
MGDNTIPIDREIKIRKWKLIEEHFKKRPE